MLGTSLIDVEHHVVTMALVSEQIEEVLFSLDDILLQFERLVR